MVKEFGAKAVEPDEILTILATSSPLAPSAPSSTT